MSRIGTIDMNELEIREKNRKIVHMTYMLSMWICHSKQFLSNKSRVYYEWNS